MPLPISVISKVSLRKYTTVSINTDDKGVFSTSLEREFSVMAAALEKKAAMEHDGNSPRRIYDWLDRIREMGFEMRFDRYS